ncbi:MAG: hypothetical protein CVU84_13460 [Firmicutes bacterium HGW-Firmicutes-1]|jgi:hypothetical protein|nr:MAG: hypothetical protein CVU84_13460 [Firmicutes bacterium HGW-Firmicutes-1]
MKIVITLVLFLALIIGSVVLQIFLSKRENRWVGLILPIICLIIATVTALGFGTFSTVIRTSTIKSMDENVNIIANEIQVVDEVADIDVNFLPVIVSVITLFLLCNIPTIILIAIYFGCREKKKTDNALNKMKIQDL